MGLYFSLVCACVCVLCAFRTIICIEFEGVVIIECLFAREVMKICMVKKTLGRVGNAVRAPILTQYSILED